MTLWFEENAMASGSLPTANDQSVSIQNLNQLDLKKKQFLTN